MAIGKFEVTYGQFKKFVEATGYKATGEQNGGYGVKDGAVKKASAVADAELEAFTKQNGEGNVEVATRLQQQLVQANETLKDAQQKVVAAKTRADLLKTAGVDRIITVDLHTDQIQGFFDGPVDHMRAQNLLCGHIAENYADHDMVVATELYARGVLQITERDRCFSVAKLFFAYGLGNALYFPFGVGASTVLFPGPPTPGNVFEIVGAHRPTLFFSVPTNYAMLPAQEAACDFSTVRWGVSAGEALPPALRRRAADVGVEGHF